MNPAARRIRALLLFACLFVTAGVASAQPAGYISLTAFGDIRQFGTSNGSFYFGSGDVSLDTTGAGAGLRLGTFLHPRWSLELGLDVATRETVDVGQGAVILIYPPIPRLDLKASTSFVDVSTMVGFHPPAMGRVHLGYRAGFSFVRATYKSEYPGYPGIPLPAYIFSATPTRPAVIPSPTIVIPRMSMITQKQNTGALTLGFDAAIDVTKSLAMVPEIRALVFSTPANGPGVFLIRPGIGVRWKF